MIAAAVSHSATVKDCYCLTPDHFQFRLRSAKGDLKRVILHHQDKYLPLKYRDTRGQVEMELLTSDYSLDYWEAELSFHMVCLRYYFELIDTAGNTMYYYNYQLSNLPPWDIDVMFDCPQNLREEERFLTPAWAENKVIYQVFPSRFATSHRISDRKWYKAPIGSRDDLHGDLPGMLSKLEHLKDLGVDILYMTPIFRSNSSHKYDTIDYYEIDPSFGTKEDFRALVEKAHALGLRVILDGVFNHTSPDFFAFADIREKEWDSPYIDWYFIEGFPLKTKWGEKPNYKTFSYYGGMPKLNVKNPQVSRYILDVALYWLREFGIDGWRLDVGDEVGHSFWKQFRKEIKAEFPEALIVGEVWHFAEDFLLGDEWDTVMNYPFSRNVLSLAAYGTIPPSQFADQQNFLLGQYHPRVYPLLWNLVDSHDTPRLLHHCGGNKQRMKLAAALHLLLPGMPMIYYGDEYAMEGGADPDCRRGMLWDEQRQDQDMFRWYQALIRLRKKHPGILKLNCKETTDDESGLITRQVGGYTLLFHSGNEVLSLPEYMGQLNLLNDLTFHGTLLPFSVAVFQDNRKELSYES